MVRLIEQYMTATEKKVTVCKRRRLVTATGDHMGKQAEEPEENTKGRLYHGFFHGKEQAR